MAFVFVELRKFVEGVDDAINADTSKTLGAILVWKVGKFTFFLGDNWSKKHEFRTKWKLHDFVYDVFDGTARYLFMTDWTMRHANTSEQKTKIVIDFGDRSNGGTRVSGS